MVLACAAHFLSNAQRALHDRVVLKAGHVVRVKLVKSWATKPTATVMAKTANIDFQCLIENRPVFNHLEQNASR